MPLKPIYEKDTALYGDDGKYILKKRVGGKIECEFIPWDAERLITVKEFTIPELNQHLNLQILWAVFDD